jgi:sodium/bile acid cotransporter 7
MLRRLRPDAFTTALIVVVALATVLPCEGRAATAFGVLTDVAIALLFFLHGAKLSREAIVAGATHHKLHLAVLGSTFLLFPALGLALRPVLAPLITPELYLGVLFLCALPSTVQSSIAFTSMARGNVSAAVCAASASSLFGILFTPLLVGFLLEARGEGGMGLGAVLDIVVLLLLPFVAGQIARRFIGAFVERHGARIKLVDQGSILLVVYTAFSEAVLEGLWQMLPPKTLAGLFVICAVLLALALAFTRALARLLRFDKEDEITLVFCGSKKSLASGIPMAKVLFAGHPMGTLVLPIMLFHQLQLMVCAVIARRYAARPETESEATPGGR